MLDKNGNRIPVLARLTTTDNPYDPFDEYEKWSDFDHFMNYNSAEEVASCEVSSEEWPDVDQVLAYEDAVDECVKLNLTGNRVKVTRKYEG